MTSPDSSAGCCPSCSARVSPGATWCSQCYHPLGVATDAVPVGVPAQAAAPEPAYAAAPASTIDPRFLWTGGPTTPAPPAQTPFGADPVGAPSGYPPAPPMRGYAPPAPMPAPVAPPRTGSLGSWGAGSTGYTVIAMILLGGLLQAVFYFIARNGHVEPEAYVRYAIVGTIAFYCVVGVVVTQRVTAGRVRLFWTDGAPLKGIALGAGIGLGLGLLLLAANSAAAGHLATDPSIALMTSEGDFAHIAAAVLLTMIAAPLIEETLFRGLLAESLRPKGRASAIWLSAAAFAAWHWRPEALRYYALMGAMFALLYFKRGLVCSMTAHLCFNGVLTVAAIVLALSPGQVVQGEGYQLTVPHGWHLDKRMPATVGQQLDGPSGATVAIMREPIGASTPTADQMLALLQGRAMPQIDPNVNVDRTAAHEVQLPTAGKAVEVPVTYKGQGGDLVMVPENGAVLIVAFESAGSARAHADFDDMLNSMTFTSAQPAG